MEIATLVLSGISVIMLPMFALMIMLLFHDRRGDK